MIKSITFPKILDLQLFAEGGTAGGDGGTGTEGATGVTATAAGSQTKGVKGNSLANVVYGKYEESAQAADVQNATPEVKNVQTPDRNAEFEKLIRGEYKDLYDARVQDTVQKRLKSSKETVEKYNALSPTLELLGKKYGVDPANIEALNQAIEEDDAYYEEEALEKGVSVEHLKEMRKVVKENAQLKRQIDAENSRKESAAIYERWMNQAEKAKQTYPGLNLREEVKNSEFASLLRAGIDVETAYTVIHKDEIIPAAMQFTAKAVEEKLANNVMANGARPTENGITTQSATVVKSDVSQLTPADMAEVIKRVRGGDKISFG